MKILQVKVRFKKVQSTEMGKKWGLFSVIYQTQLDLNKDTEWRFYNGFNSHYHDHGIKKDVVV